MPSVQEQIKTIQEKYAPEIARLEERAKEVQDSFHNPDDWEAVINVDFDVDWKDQEFFFDVPTVTMKTQDLSLDLPELRMDTQTIIFHTPSIRMVDRKVGQYPEWHGPFKIVWKDIIISVPEPFMEEQRIILDLPTVTMKRQDFSLDLPEFKMETIRFVIGLPQITIRNISAETAKVKDAGEALRVEGENIASRMKSEIEMVVGGTVNSSGQQSTETVQEISSQYDAAINALIKSIDELTAKGIDPIKVPTDKGEINLRKQLSDLIAERDKVLGEVPQPKSS